jgi:hypothetical protein
MKSARDAGRMGGKPIFDRLARTPPQMISEGSGGENK